MNICIDIRDINTGELINTIYTKNTIQNIFITPDSKIICQCEMHIIEIFDLVTKCEIARLRSDYREVLVNIVSYKNMLLLGKIL